MKNIYTYIKAAAVTILMLYAAFLYLDFTGVNSPMLTDTLKYLCIILCFFIAVVSLGNSIDRKGSYILIAALFFTLISDYFLLLKDKFFIGIMFFCIVQFFHTLRHCKMKVSTVLIRFSVCFASIFGIYGILHLFVVKIDPLFPLALFYFTCLLNSVYSSIAAFIRAYFPYPNRLFVMIGMLLFLLCDINVGIYNLTGMLVSNNSTVNLMYSMSSNLMWFFYAPSQFLLSISNLEFNSQC